MIEWFVKHWKVTTADFLRTAGSVWVLFSKHRKAIAESYWERKVWITWCLKLVGGICWTNEGKAGAIDNLASCNWSWVLSYMEVAYVVSLIFPLTRTFHEQKKKILGMNRNRALHGLWSIIFPWVLSQKPPLQTFPPGLSVMDEEGALARGHIALSWFFYLHIWWTPLASIEFTVLIHKVMSGTLCNGEQRG